MKEAFINIKNAICFAVTTYIEEEYGYTKEMQKLPSKKKLRKKPKMKGKK